MTSSTQLFPEVIDGSTLTSRPTSGVFLPIGVEGTSASGTAAVGVVKQVARESDAETFFGATSTLAKLVKYLLVRGAGPVYAVASADTTPGNLTAKQAAWQTLEAIPDVRIRMTDDVTQATLVALGTSCDYANLLNNKQFAIAGMASGTTKANLITAAGAINSKRLVLVGPAIYDENGVLLSGLYAAASVAAMVAQNDDISDDLDTATLPINTDIEHDANGNALFRRIVTSGTVQNDFEDLLQAGVSPLMPGLNGGVAISHLRMTYTVNGVTPDSTFDALMTRIILDQQFVLVRDYCMNFNQLRKGNTPDTRAQLASGVDALLKTLSDIIQPVVLGDGSTGYGVRVDPSDNERQQIISYQGKIVRGVQTILVAPSFTIST